MIRLNVGYSKEGEYEYAPISGKIILPNGHVAPEQGMKIQVESHVVFKKSDKENERLYYQGKIEDTVTVFIPPGKQSSEFQLNAPKGSQIKSPSIKTIGFLSGILNNLFITKKIPPFT